MKSNYFCRIFFVISLLACLAQVPQAFGQLIAYNEDCAESVAFIKDPELKEFDQHGVALKNLAVSWRTKTKLFLLHKLQQNESLILHPRYAFVSTEYRHLPGSDGLYTKTRKAQLFELRGELHNSQYVDMVISESNPDGTISFWRSNDALEKVKLIGNMPKVERRKDAGDRNQIIKNFETEDLAVQRTCVQTKVESFEEVVKADPSLRRFRRLNSLLAKLTDLEARPDCPESAECQHAVNAQMKTIDSEWGTLLKESEALERKRIHAKRPNIPQRRDTERLPGDYVYQRPFDRRENIERNRERALQMFNCSIAFFDIPDYCKGPY